MGQLDASIVTLIFPALQREFAQPLAAVQWVSLAYLLALIGSLAAVGRFADSYGRKLLYVYGFAVFTAASAACGVAPTLWVLIVFRVLQAIGAAMLQANSVALVVTSVGKSHARAALGVQAAAQALGLAAGPAVGGLLVDSLGWRYVFLVNVPVGILGLIAGQFLLPRTRDSARPGRFDWLGAILLATASTTLLLAVSVFSGLALPLWSIPTMVVAGIACAAALIRRERRIDHPVIDPTVLRPAAVSMGLVGALCGYLVLFGPLTLLPQLHGGHGGVGLVLSCLPAGFALAAVCGERILPASVGTRVRAVGGAAVATFGCLALLLSHRPDVATAAALFGTGVGLGMFIPANNAAIMRAVPTRMSATGGGMVNMARGLGTALGVTLVALCLHTGGSAGAQVALGVLAGAGVIAGISAIRSPAVIVTP
ncbi:MFS transporter [Skermania sp. ID1734]|nr:MFS transporter [Skermania sp. ID1734]